MVAVGVRVVVGDREAIADEEGERDGDAVPVEEVVGVAPAR